MNTRPQTTGIRLGQGADVIDRLPGNRDQTNGINLCSRSHIDQVGIVD